MQATKTNRRRRRRPDDAVGNCYEAAIDTLVRLCRSGCESDYRLVHAEIVGQGPIEGVRHGHAFVVDVVRGVVYDESNGRTLCWPLAVYAAVSRMAEANNSHEYTFAEAARKMLDTGVYGPWDLETSTGL